LHSKQISKYYHSQGNELQYPAKSVHNTDHYVKKGSTLQPKCIKPQKIHLTAKKCQDHNFINTIWYKFGTKYDTNQARMTPRRPKQSTWWIAKV